MKPERLSALVVACNEQAQLADCLKTLKFADELVVVLDKCTDGSKDIAKKFADRIVEGAWKFEADRQHAGIDACSGDWVLHLDADERVTPGLAEEVRKRINCSPPGYFLIPFDNYIGDRLVRYGWGGSFGVSAAARLYTPGAKRWSNEAIHPKITLKGERQFLEQRIIHYHDRDISDMIRRFDRYTSMQACDLREGDNIGTFHSNFRRIFTRFFKCYVQRKGYREGYYGFLIGLFAGLMPIIAFLKARLEKN